MDIVLEYSQEPNLKFREATFSILKGSRARHLLRNLVDFHSFSNLMALLETYNGVVEFAAYSVSVGIVPNRNTVIFEVRAY